MSPAYWIAIGTSVALLLFLFMLLRARRLREKYAALWILLAISVCVVGAFPDLVFWMAEAIGVVSPANLLFSASLIILLLVCLQLSAELTSTEEEIRTLAEEVALLKMQVDQILQADQPPAQPATKGQPTDAG